MNFNFTNPTRTWRGLAAGKGGAVASNHPLATNAGAEVLRQGGNAADAAVAVASTLGVVEPQMSGVGADGFLLHWDAAARRGTVINATGPAPRAATRERFLQTGLPRDGAITASVPGSVDGWLTLRDRFGSRPLPELFGAAIHYAREGFACTRRLRDFIVAEVPMLRRFPTSAALFLPGGEPPPVGGTIRQADLARTLEEIAAEGRGALYGGDLGCRLAESVQAAGGLISREDLADYHCEVVEPITVDYRGWTVLQAPPNSVGYTLLQELGIVEHTDLAALEPLSPDWVHTLVEAKKLAFIDRERYAGDPRFTHIPLDTILNRGHMANLADRLDRRRATPRWQEVPTAALATAGGDAGAGSDTTYFAVIDRHGNAVSAIQSTSDFFGSGFTAGDTGINLNSRMRPWHLEPGHPNMLQPGKRVRHTMNCPLLIRDGQARAVWGTPGGDAQVQINLQTLTLLLDGAHDPQQAVEAPRWCSFEPEQNTYWPHHDTERLQLEDRFPASVQRDLAARGHHLEVVGPLGGPCSAQMIARQPDGTLLAGSDPRRDGWSAAW